MDGKGCALLKIHLRRALIHVQKCIDTPTPLLDVCGEAGDLFFLLEFLWGQTRDLARMAQLLQDMLALTTEETKPLALSRRELMQMAEMLEAD